VLCRLADLLLNGWDNGRMGDRSLARELGLDALGTPEGRLALLEPLALGFQQRPDPGRDQPATLSYAEIESLLSKGLAGLANDPRHAVEPAMPELLAWCRRHGLLLQTSHDTYAMPRRQVREYLAGRALAAQPDFPTRAYALRGDPRWRETLLHASRELGRGPAPHVARLLVRLLLHPQGSEQAVRGDDVLLAAECLIEIGDRSRSDRALRAEVQQRLIERIGARDAELAERVRAGMLLGQLGDTRFAGPLPPHVDVAAGPFILGTPEGYDDEGPRQWVDVPDFAIGRYPVTNQEYAAFLADNPGHAAPHYWHDPRFNNPACPVVGVTWNDAVSYCAWLNDRLARAELLPPGRVVRLPLEVEWEKAAGWDPLRQVQTRYPWGDEWSAARANTTDGRGNWMTAPVGCYPDGASPYDLHDCIGNVWEWTASVYSSYPGAAVPFNEPGSYTLRGSSCASTPTHARCTYRSRLPASYWRYHLGFRIVIGRPLHALIEVAGLS
jgi:formylglycine-generating enzyme required for sulfatase activity